MLTEEDLARIKVLNLNRDEWGLRPQDSAEVHARDDILIRCNRLRRDGITFVLPPIVRRPR